MRYIRQSLFNKIGEEGQRKIGAGSALVVGCGALGCGTANLLARAGVGRLTIVDRDFVELHNLSRQTLFSEKDVGKLKALAAKEILSEVNSEIAIRGVCDDVNSGTILGFLQGADLVCDCTDNMQTRFLINDACGKHGIPWIYAGAVASYGATMTILPDGGPCFRCLFPAIPDARMLPTCDTVGILGSIPALVSSIQATEALKLLVGAPPRKSLLMYDIWDADFELVEVARRDDCPCCAQKRYEFLDASAEDSVAVLCGRNAVQITPARRSDIDFNMLSEKLRKAGTLESTSHLLTFSADGYTLCVFRDGRCIVKGTDDESVAKSLYARYIGA